jgi:hypothetical protein
VKASRRTFLIGGVAAVSALTWKRQALADTAPKLDESDPQAKQYSYKLDATKVDVATSPAYKAGQTCANCSLFQGQSGDPYGGCIIFGNKQVAAAGWCNAYTNS